MNPAGFAQAVSRAVASRDRLTPRQRAREHAHFEKVRRAEVSYAVQLRKIARHVGDIIRGFPPGEPEVLPELLRVLGQYASVIHPWARAQAVRMLTEVSRRDAQAWFRSSEELGRNLRQELRDVPNGQEVSRILEEQVRLITSIPTEAGRRVQQLTQELVVPGGRRYAEIVPEIMNSGNVTISRANLIARTETAKAQSALTQARARHIGATHYIWRTAHDRDVRPVHKRLEGTVHAWDDPPVAEENGEHHHPGEFPNCRCWAEPIIPDVIE